MVVELETERLRLRAWKAEDREPFFRLSSNPDVMEFFPDILTKTQSDTFIDNCIRKFEMQGGWGLWAVELKQNGEFIGSVGLNVPNIKFPFSPFVEIGWRLDKPFWRQGYTCEAARRIFDFAFTEIGLEEVVAFTTISNYRSENVMKKLGMVRDEKTFLHPGLEKNHPLREHVLYRLRRSDFV
ncbi:GNAT family N-acetyltransferase [Xenorhabdus griffiniae]|uniref:GNAT family N-acetyltransferase n=1 Tax=Xenorhabdus griffiniae TaxID=351672 RepID=A0ABY9XKT8_9GAMM|nr:GNAT family N-acetyltransferase [Xenorhabdus griffiniae]MBD1228909.1 GNAT family N-acetyltransferase [Xenorhabdus griffiniae]MBE8589023.1 GNAT family N-acetyltransferase [Xenorhabdus griffiniae]WMV73388.1 GNAT family N-acetyltransferase [Xenorhabdus griffiniae]WNH03067.1 GNAT family N-acetyltransferase [Xenorhabdus griffiniae]